MKVLFGLLSGLGEYLGNSGQWMEVENGRTPEKAFTITKTSPCNEDPPTPHFYIVKLGFTGAYIFFLFLL